MTTTGLFDELKVGVKFRGENVGSACCGPSVHEQIPANKKHKIAIFNRLLKALILFFDLFSG